MASLEKTRKEIDRLDRELVRLLAERMAAVRRIGSFKKTNPTAPLRDEERERVGLRGVGSGGRAGGAFAVFRRPCPEGDPQLLAS